MKNIEFIKLSFLVIALSQVCHSLSLKSNLEVSNGARKEEIDYQAFYTGTQSLETERLILRQITLSDAQDVFHFKSNPEVETWNAVDKTIEDTQRFIECLQKKYLAKEPTIWGIASKNDNKLIGYCGFTFIQPEYSIVELEYALDKPYWHKGLMPEALEALLFYTFNTLKINRIIAFVLLNNANSAKVLSKIGMQSEGMHREAGYSRGMFWDMHSYALLRKDYLARQTKAL